MESTQSSCKSEKMLVEIFKTNVNNEGLAAEIITTLKKLFPDYEINFDLDDCDRILRVEPENGIVEVDKIMRVVSNFSCEIEIVS